MTLWLTLAILGCFFSALTAVGDKFLLSKDVKHPIAYAFYIGIIAPTALLLIPIGFLGSWVGINFFKTDLSFQFLSPSYTLIALVSGALFPLALYFFYKAVQHTSISRILPITGGLVPCFTFVLAYLLLGERLTSHAAAAFIFLVVGAIFISLKKQRGHWHAVAFGNATIASFLFALSFTLEKLIFTESNFGSGFVWTRLGFFAAALSFLILPVSRKYILNTPKQTSTDSKLVFVGTRVAAAAAGLFQNYAIAIGSVTLVNALQGTQYVFVLLLAVLLSVSFPKILKEDISESKILLKVFSIILIFTGLYFLAK